MSFPAQQILNLTTPPAYDETDFFVSASNQIVFDTIQSWPQWPTHCLIVYGEQGSGKTHLAHIWAKRAEAKILTLKDLEDQNLDQLAKSSPNLVVEDIPLVFNPNILFHLYNAIKQANGYLMMTSLYCPKDWKVSLPDLLSRLRSANWLEIQTADEELLRAMMHKILADEQVLTSPHIIDYLLNHHDRSFSGLQEALHKINSFALATQRRITLPLVKEALK